ncbi:MAG: ABC transporter substrate-binding protein [Gemmatimonadales bacterium]
MRGLRSLTLIVIALFAVLPASAQSGRRDAGVVTIVVGADPTVPVPTLAPGKADVDLASLLFLPLARPDRRLATADEKSFEPMLARAWTRRDSLTLAFDLDPRARWHDGVPVTSRDVVWSLDRARDSAVSPTYALLLRRIASVTAEGPSRVVVRFKEAYAEQLYDAVYHAAPLPAHLLDTIPEARLVTSRFVAAPIGSGPYRFVRAERGRQVVLAADTAFFLGRPRIEQVVFLVVGAAEAQLNLMLDGTADAFEAFILPRQITPIVEQPSLRIVTMPSLGVGYLLFNRKAYGDRSRPHPILADADVRRALAMGVDRTRILRTVFGPYASLVDGPMGQASWVRRISPKGPAFDPGRARRLLESRGWVDRNGDGIREKDGQPLTLRLNYPGSSIPRVGSAEIVQAMLRDIGVRIELVRLEGPVWAQRRRGGEFDIDFSQTVLDPTPSGLVQSWSCAGIGGTNVAQICDPAFDAALTRAIRATRDVPARWREAITTLQNAAPAIFLYSPIQSVVLSTRYRNVSVRPDLPWSDLWRWSVDPGRRLPRDQR